MARRAHRISAACYPFACEQLVAILTSDHFVIALGFFPG